VSYLLKRKRAPLAAQLEALTPDEIRVTVGIVVSLSEVRTLTIDWAKSWSVQAKQEVYLSFSLFSMKHTGAAVNCAFIEQLYTAFREAICSAETASKLVLEVPPTLAPSLVETCGCCTAINTQEFRSCAAAWKWHRSHVCGLLQGSTD
jgi:hypothetical protein